MVHVSFVLFFVFEIKEYHYKDMADLQYKLLNILSLICYNSDYYCFCNKYQGCEKDYHLGRNLCTLCCIKIHFKDFKEYFPEKNQFNFLKLKTYAFKFYPFLMECNHVGLHSLEAFFGHYVW